MKAYRSKRFLRAVQFLCLLILSSNGIAHAQGGFPGGGPGGPGGSTVDAYFDMDVLKRSEVQDRMQALGNDLMGDQIDPNTGSLSFSHTDVSIPGNSGLEVAIRRTRSFGDPYTQFNSNYTASNGKASLSFGDWELGVPKVSIVSATPYSVCDSSEPGAATTFLTVFSGASETGNPANLEETPGSAENEATTDGNSHSNGVRVNVPGRTQGLLLDNPVFNLTKNGANKTSLDHWSFSCILTGNGGLIGTAPNGDEYRFDQFVTRPAKRINMQSFSFGVSSSYSYGFLERFEFVFQVSRVEDVNGNYVDYDYDADGWLTRIEANDGRLIEITRDNQGFVDQIEANGRLWQYSYFNKANGGRLTSVTRDDGSAWSFELGSMTYDPAQFWGECENGLRYTNSVSITHPYGAEGVFTFMDTKHLRAPALHAQGAAYPQVPHCSDKGNPTSEPDTATTLSRYNIVASVIEKRLKVTSNDTNPAIWTYDYSEESIPESQGQKWSDVTDPAGTRTRRMYHVDDQIELDSLINWAKVYDGNNDVIREINYDYEFEAPIGTTWLDNENLDRLTRPRRTIKTITKQDDDTYTSETGFNMVQSASDYSFGNPTSKRTYSDRGNSAAARGTDIIYEHKRPKWILGLPKTIHEVASNSSREVTSYNYDANGQQISQTRYGEPWTTYGYYNDGTIEWIEDALGRRSEASNWKGGTPQLIKQAVGSANQIETEQLVDDNGWITSSTDAMGRTTSYSYDVMGRLKKVNPTGNIWSDTNITYSFPSSGGAVQTIAKGQAKTTVTYDAMFRSILERSQALDTSWSSYVNTEYDGLGRAIFKSQPSTNPSEADGVETAYDGLGRVYDITETVAPYAKTKHRYYSSHRHRIYDPSGAFTQYYSYGYGGPGNKDYSHIYRYSEGAYRQKTVLYKNNWGQMTRLRQFGAHDVPNVDKSQYFYYDSNQRLCRHYVPEHGATKYNYDAAGQMIAYAKGQSNSGCTVSSSNPARVYQDYDALGRPTVTNFRDSATPDITRTYDDNGNILNLNRGTGSSAVNWTYAYNDINLLTSENLSVDDQNFEISYLYNGNGDLKRRTYPSGRYTRLYPDGLGRATRSNYGSADYVNNLTYHPSGAVHTFQYRNGQDFTQTLNNRLLPDSIVSKKGAIKAIDQTLSYDARGLVTSIIDGAVPGNDRTYSYDGLGYLKTASGPWGSGSYKYDSIGNLREKKLGSRTVDLTYDSKNRLTRSDDSGASGDRMVTYDHRGNVTGLGTLSFVYDMSDQPVTVSGSHAGSTIANNSSFTYDGNLKRVKSQINGKVIYNMYDASGALTYQYEPVGDKKTDYLRAAGMTIGRRSRTGGVTYLHPDHLGSAQAGTKSDGGIKWREQYTPFGEALVNNSQNDNLAGFTGHIKDKATGLNYMQARYYDPVIGRFLSIDPVGFLDTGNPGMFNRYSYVHNDPINMMDPSGLCATNADGNVSCPEGIHRSGEENVTAEQADLAQSLFSDVVRGVESADSAHPLTGQMQDGVSSVKKVTFEFTADEVEASTNTGDDVVIRLSSSMLKRAQADTKDGRYMRNAIKGLIGHETNHSSTADKNAIAFNNRIGGNGYDNRPGTATRFQEQNNSRQVHEHFDSQGIFEGYFPQKYMPYLGGR